MLPRLLKLPKTTSLFLFGARGTGKSTLIQTEFRDVGHILFNLLDPMQEEELSMRPQELEAQVLALPSNVTHIIIDEVQKIPKLLDVVHKLIETTDKKFILTGSSARKLKRGGANLLAGRAFVYNLFPFSFLELGDQFELDLALRWGMLPKMHFFSVDEQRFKFLQAYTNTYLKEEIWSEQIIRKLNPFRKFLEVSAQANGKIVNYANIARDVGVDDKTIAEYFAILEDTLIGFFIEPFHNSFRKRLSAKPKFYYFDPGVVRSLIRQLSVPLQVGTSSYGEVFEHFIVVECLKLATYYKPEYRFSYLRTKDDVEVDLVVERPGLAILFIEIKSSSAITALDLSNFAKITEDFGECEAVCFAKVPRSKSFGKITVIPWQLGIKKFFT